MPGVYKRYVNANSIVNPLKESTSNPPKKTDRILRDLAQLNSSKKIFNEWITKGITDQVRRYSFETDDVVVEFLKATVERPQYIDSSCVKKDVYPNQSRTNRKPYDGKLKLTIRITQKGENPVAETSEVHIGNVPIMVGSQKCNLYKLTPEERVAKGESFEDPGGYFIINTERSVIVQEKSRMSYPLIVVEKGGVSECRYTTSNNIKSFVVTLRTTKQLSIHMAWEMMKDMKKHDIPVMGVFKLLSGNLDSSQLIDNYILPFIPSKFKAQCKSVLRISVILAATVYGHEEGGNEMESIVGYLAKLRNEGFESIGKEEIDKIRKYAAESVFRNIPFDGGAVEESNSTIKDKLYQLGSIVAKYTMFLSGITQEDFRDSWGLKRFDTPGIAMSMLFTSIFNKTIRDIKNTIESNEVFNPQRVLNDIQSKCGNFDKCVAKSFNGSTWGYSSSKSSANITEQTKMDTPIQMVSQITKSNTPTNRRSKNPALRNIQSSQITHTCTAETPEGEKNGLIKHKAITSFYSLNQDSSGAIKLVKDSSMDVKIVKPIEYDPLDYSEHMIAHITYDNDGDLIEYVCPGELLFENTKVLPKEIRKLVKKQLDPEVGIYTFEIIRKCKKVELKPVSLYWVTVNGNVITKNGEICKVNEGFKDVVVDLRRTGVLPKFLEIYRNEKMNSFEIYTDASRPCACYFVVNKATKKLVIDEKKSWDKSVDELLSTGCMEFVSAREFENADIVIAESVEDFYVQSDYGYSHCMVDPLQMFSLVTSLNPWSNHQPSPRSTYQASMIKQALTVYNTNWHLFLKNFKRLKYPDRPLAESVTVPVVDMDIHPAGQTAIVAFLAHPANQEDAVVVTDNFVNSGKFTYIRYTTLSITQEKTNDIEEKLTKPFPKINEDPEKYSAVGDDGLPILDRYVREGDCIVGMTQLIKADGVETPSNHFTGIGEYGYVDRVTKIDEKGNIIIHIRLRQENKYIAGDKVAFRYSQKGTIARIVAAKDMPRIMSGPNKGVIPDVLFNPIGFPSRRTVGLLIEGLVSKAALYSGERQNCTAFRNNDEAIESAGRVLAENGMSPDGKEDMGLKERIFCAPVFYQILKHQVLDKIQMRDSGRVKPLTHQPVRGRTKRGGLRNGEMEKDADAAHGSANCLLDRMMESSDLFEIVVCQKCGYFTNSRDEINDCSCRNSSPGLLTIPYIFKLFVQLIQTMGIDLRINTKKVAV